MRRSLLEEIWREFGRRILEEPNSTPVPITIHPFSLGELLDFVAEIIECRDRSRKWDDYTLPQLCVPIAEP